MAKNILIFSDGTGQAGGITFDEDRTNIYKLYRATRCGPDSSVNPAEQVTFYDPGLGSPRDNHFAFGWLGRKVYNLISRATGFGITANIIDCYAAIIRLWTPGDRIVLFGFSRGAYTVRCLCGVISRCGIPTCMPDGSDIKRDVASTRKLATYAVKHVYQFTSSVPEKSATKRQLFLLKTRKLIAKRFREQYGSTGVEGKDANCYPYFIGVFDTVASLFSLKMLGLLLLLLIPAIFLLAGISLLIALIPSITFKEVFAGLVGVCAFGSFGAYVYTHFKWDFCVPGYSRWDKFKTIHRTERYNKFYDYILDNNVPYAKHAISIDEDRKDFPRVWWDPVHTDRPVRDKKGNIYFEQVWFAGNHADIGGGYAENESRLSDIALNWMWIAARTIPDGIKFDRSVLTLHPAPEGPQHDEVKSGYGLVTRVFGINWPKESRELPTKPSPNNPAIRVSDATMHRSVYKRFDQSEGVLQYDVVVHYRPDVLRSHIDFARFYLPGAPFPSTTEATAENVADDPEVRERREIGVILIFYSVTREALAKHMEEYLLDKDYAANSIKTDFSELSKESRLPAGSISVVYTNTELANAVKQGLRLKFPEMNHISDSVESKLSDADVQIRLF